MSGKTIRIGFDYWGNRFYAARVENGGGRTEIKALLQFEPAHLGRHKLLQEGQAIIAVADDLLTTRRFRLDNHPSPYKERAAFEMATMLMADEADFYFDVLPTGWSDFLLGMALRKTRWEEFTQILPTENGKTYFERGQSRAVCLAKGYLKFCKPIGGELITLIDFSPKIITLIYLYQKQIVEIATIPAEQFDFNDKAQRKKLLMECKTVLSFKSSALFEEGITVPPAHLLVTGLTDTTYLDEIKQYFSMTTSVPELNSGYLALDDDLAQEKIGRYLIPLGATLE